MIDLAMTGGSMGSAIEQEKRKKEESSINKKTSIEWIQNMGKLTTTVHDNIAEAFDEAPKNQAFGDQR